MKKFLFNLISLAYRFKSRFAESRMINEMLEHLKKSNKLKQFPYNECKPEVLKYPNLSTNDKKWLDFFYSVTGKADKGFIPLNYFNSYIEPCLNDITLIAGLQEKNFYELLFKDVKTPEVILRKINGFFYRGDYSPITLNDEMLQSLFENYDNIIMKPSVESGSGRSIMLFQRKKNNLVSNGEIFNLDFIQKYKPDFVIQECVKQHQFFKKFNPSSNNTLRIFLYRSIKDDKIHVLHKLLRIGKQGSFLDHDNLGGLGISIKEENHFDEYAYNYYGDRFSSVNNIKFSEAGKVPFIDETCEVAIKTASRIFYARLLALDFTVDEEGNVLLIEINCWGNGITQYQMNNGSLFKEFTNEILEYCYSVSQNKIRFNPRFTIQKPHYE
jgi:hypothetical protein